MKISLNINEIRNTDVKSLQEWLIEDDIARVARTSEGQYRLYKNLSHQYNKAYILDLGTRRGASAVAFADNPTNYVLTVDVREFTELKTKWEKRTNLEYLVSDVLALPRDWFSRADIIHLDLSHDGLLEKLVVEEKINKSDFDGLLIMDDINFRKFPELTEFYKSITRRRMTLPIEISHFSGTAFVLYNEIDEVTITL